MPHTDRWDLNLAGIAATFLGVLSLIATAVPALRVLVIPGAALAGVLTDLWGRQTGLGWCLAGPALGLAAVVVAVVATGS